MTFFEQECFVLSKVEIGKHGEKTPTYVSETVHYSGHMGLVEIDEEFRGLCVSKSGSELFISRRVHQNIPKIYFLRDRKVSPHDGRVDFFNGFFVEHSKSFDGFFESPFVCVRDPQITKNDLDVYPKSSLHDDMINAYLYR